MYTIENYKESADYILSKIGNRKPAVLMILGSGLGFMADEVEDAISIPYGDIPNFKSSTVMGHAGKLVVGTLAGTQVAVMHGRMHCYEGYQPYDVAYPVRVAKLLGIESMIVTNAAGAVNEDYNVGELMLIKVENKSKNRSDIMTAVDVFRANVIDYSPEAMCIEVTGQPSKIDAFVKLMQPFGILEMCRTGIVALERGANTLFNS